MNKSYNCLDDGTVIVKDEKGLSRIVENTDNLDSILIKENVIEELQNEIQESKYTLGNQETLKKKKYSILNYITNTIIPTIAIIPLAGLALPTPINVIGAALWLTYAASRTVFHVKMQRKTQRTITALQIKIENLEEKLYSERKELDGLRLDRNKENQKQDDNSFRLSNDKELSALSELEELCYQTGLDIKELYEAYIKGTLKEKLSNLGHDDNQIAIIQGITMKNGSKTSRGR